jgi:CDGSH-type Zn-finger protein
MEPPSWQDKKNGSMIRAALWLEREVGEGNIFKKSELREAFPDVAQIDRRIRDLRDFGWQIDTRREDDRLLHDEQRYAKKGAEVWVPGQRRANAKVRAGLSAVQRARIMDGDDHLCRSCGISAGEPYPDGQDAQLDVARRKVILEDGSEDVQLVTECNRCRVGGRDRLDDVGALIETVRGLTQLEQRVLLEWMAADQRTLGSAEEAWGRYRALPEESRKAVRQALAEDQD